MKPSFGKFIVRLEEETAWITVGNSGIGLAVEILVSGDMTGIPNYRATA